MPLTAAHGQKQGHLCELKANLLHIVSLGYTVRNTVLKTILFWLNISARYLKAVKKSYFEIFLKVF